MSGERGPKAHPSVDEGTVGARVVALRSEGRSYASIAKTVGLKRSTDAFTTFVHEVAQRSPSEQVRLRAEENSRLDTLEERTRARNEASELDRKIAIIVQLRERLAAE